jgi:ribonuclease D
MTQDDKEIKAQLKKLKPKKKLAVPAEFLDNAKSYEDKLGLVQVLTEKEKGRVLLIIKSMLADAVKSRNRK